MDVEWLRGLQSIVAQCIDNADLCSELYCQLIKQTMDTPDPNGPCNLAYWKIMAIICNLRPPPQKCLLAYARAHFKRSAADSRSDEGRFAIYCIKKNENLYNTGQNWQLAISLCTGKLKIEEDPGLSHLRFQLILVLVKLGQVNF
ncbi:cytochrome c oxidase subunit 1 [Cichlidogyrus casuarinus]|uniref:Cytochrome c oxidase subunit 1 n=1 Tax=Cichlidogyrus casuarinus TaxID=1844966 RepID=A0ABD2QBB4_9PLAT